jgi:hypothetical protein
MPAVMHLTKLSVIYASLGLPLSFANAVVRFMDGNVEGGRNWCAATIVWIFILVWSLYQRKKN